ncbi:MAG: DUF86 domain-containing protein [Methanoregula sp.]|uniref:HepT-like ribonuclease domain-containing protein n=1 Tax=Methanoregula sp. TaxID=2052170 RepID=UPI0025E8116D|nr:DUF86 domain-containing protein [Methanoregula sp.]MCK9630615.1 DUF86 domain-containing protein [Methanoregula sp.]
MKDDWVYLQHILDEIEYLEGVRSSLTSYEHFIGDKTLCRAVTRSLEIIGEATKNVTDPVRTAHPEIPWKFMAGIRDKIIHGYFAIDYEIIWDIIQNKLPGLEPDIRAIRDEMKRDAKTRK